MEKRSSSLILAALLAACSCSIYAQESMTIQINTHFKEIEGKPSWLLIVYDLDSSAVYPYLFDINERNNHFTIYTNSMNYRLVSIMQFSKEDKKIANFCNLPADRISRESLTITIDGTLSSTPNTSNCLTRRWKNDF